jgi:putative hydrolase of the HAD superfamily
MAQRERAKALLLDFDGVLRHYDPAVDNAVEDRYGLEHGTIFRTAMEPQRYQTLVSGGWTRSQWLADVAAYLEIPLDAWAELGAYRGYIDHEVLAFVRDVRAAGVPVALCSNAPTDLDEDIAQLGLTEEFDAVVNSSVIGAAKPAADFFKAACLAVRTVPRLCLFVDDSHRNVEGARKVGIAAYRWNGVVDLPYLKAALDVPQR